MASPKATEIRHSLLDEPVFSVRLADGSSASLSLPGVLAALQQGQVKAFTRLQLHQGHAWHAFLVQLGAISLLHHDAESLDDIQAAEPHWRQLLLSLTGGAREPWALVVSDLARPAFMQPPVPEGSLAKFEPVETADDLDILVTSKSHDVKMGRIASPEAEHWAYSLITLQTMQGFLGAGNYGIARMNGGFSSRPAVAAVYDERVSPRFRREVELVCEHAINLANKGDMVLDGPALLWNLPWDGTTSLALSDLHPLFIEVCRRLRLTTSGRDGVEVWKRPTVVGRIAAKEVKGNTGDPWTPIDTAEAKAISVTGDGFPYSLMRDFIFSPHFSFPVEGMSPRGTALEAKSASLVAHVLVRGQGITEGLHERRLLLPPDFCNVQASDVLRDRWAQATSDWINAAGEFSKSVLKPTLLCLTQCAPEKLDFKDDRGDRWLRRFDAEVDASFFPFLWNAMATASPDNDTRTPWQMHLDQIARRIVDVARRSTPTTSARCYEIWSKADGIYFRMRKKHFPNITFAQSVTSADDGEESDERTMA